MKAVSISSTRPEGSPFCCTLSVHRKLQRGYLRPHGVSCVRAIFPVALFLDHLSSFLLHFSYGIFNPERVRICSAIMNLHISRATVVVAVVGHSKSYFPFFPPVDSKKLDAPSSRAVPRPRALIKFRHIIHFARGDVRAASRGVKSPSLRYQNAQREK